KYEFMLANVDGIVIDQEGKKCIFEAKTASAYKADQWKDDEIPEGYMLQIQHYMAVTGYERAYIAVLIGGNTFKYKVVDKDEELINMIIQIEKQFWDCVVNDIPPEVDGSESCTNMLNSLYASSKKGKSIILPNEAQELIEEYNKNKEQESYYTEKKNECINKLKSLMEDNEVATINNLTITWKSSVSERIDTKKLKEEQPEIYNKYLKKINMRRFMIK
ncbi:YqaJ viral recombinase family protein, partial [Clostridium sp.]|uniref:YqaJ viral recombinase family nuclease n=1 Tax=Clostridium sp. TaxID=1506 RepID=UPI0029153317